MIQFARLIAASRGVTAVLVGVDEVVLPEVKLLELPGDSSSKFTRVSSPEFVGSATFVPGDSRDAPVEVSSRRATKGVTPGVRRITTAESFTPASRLLHWGRGEGKDHFYS
tara:strand:- start:18409 stop:18741 length:333 start_codon:yes stop_codon:yes gene_type:complete